MLIRRKKHNKHRQKSREKEYIDKIYDFKKRFHNLQKREMNVTALERSVEKHGV